MTKPSKIDLLLAACEILQTQTEGQGEGNFPSLQTEEDSSVASFKEVQIQTEDLSPPTIKDLSPLKDDVLIKVSETVKIREHNKQTERTNKQANKRKYCRMTCAFTFVRKWNSLCQGLATLTNCLGGSFLAGTLSSLGSKLDQARRSVKAANSSQFSNFMYLRS